MITESQRAPALELFEVMKKVANAKNKAERVDILQKNDHVSIRDYLRCLFDDRIQFLLPGGTPPYTPQEEGAQPSSWRRQNTKLQYWVKGIKAAEGLTNIKRESIFINVLESVHPSDAELIVKMINKDNDTKGLTKNVVSDAFPGLIQV